MKQLILKMSYMTPSRLRHQNNMPSSSTQVVASQNSSSNEQQYWQSLLKKQPRKRSPYQQPSRNMRTCFPRKPPPNYHPLDHMTMPLNSKTHSFSNRPRLTCSIPLNIKLAKSFWRTPQDKENLSRLHHSSLLKRRKPENYAPAKIIGTSIAIPSRMPTPFPLSPTLLTNYEDHWSSPNSMYNRGTITSSSSQRTDRRLPSPPD